MAVRDIEQKASVQEIYGIEGMLEDLQGAFDVHNTTRYPAIMEDRSTFLDFHTDIMTARGKYGGELPRDVAAYIWYAEKYFNHLLLFITSFKEVDLPSFGAVFLKDIMGWHTDFDDLLVKSINSTPVNLELHHGEKWEREKEKVLKTLWEKSLLKKAVDGDTDSIMDLFWRAVDDVSTR